MSEREKESSSERGWAGRKEGQGKVTGEDEVSSTDLLQVCNFGIVPTVPNRPRLLGGQHDKLDQLLLVQLISENINANVSEPLDVTVS